jgi:hypothetical protein
MNRINRVFIPPGHDDPKLRLWCTICMRYYRQDEDSGRWYCEGCGKVYQEQGEGKKILRADISDPLITHRQEGPERPADFPKGSIIIRDEELDPTTGESQELQYD